MTDRVGETTRVECYSGSRYGERPLSFTLGPERYVVETVEKSWRTPSALHFRVRTQDDGCFELAYRYGPDEWNVEAIPTEGQM